MLKNMRTRTRLVLALLFGVVVCGVGRVVGVWQAAEPSALSLAFVVAILLISYVIAVKMTVPVAGLHLSAGLLFDLYIGLGVAVSGVLLSTVLTLQGHNVPWFARAVSDLGYRCQSRQAGIVTDNRLLHALQVGVGVPANLLVRAAEASNMDRRHYLALSALVTSLALLPLVVIGVGVKRMNSSGSPWLLIGSVGAVMLLAVGGVWYRRRVLLRRDELIQAGPHDQLFSTGPDDGIGLSVVIPAYNEALRLPTYLTSIVAYLRKRGERFEVVVADDGSTDDTVEVVNRMAQTMPEIRTVANPRNFGKGFAVRTGIANSYGKRVLFVDADGATPISEIERLEHAMRDGASIVIGSRAVSGPGIVRSTQSHRKVIGRIFNGIVSTLLLPGLKDTQCGFKLFTRDAAGATFGRQNLDGFSFDVELLFIGRRMRYRLDEVAVSWSDVSGSKVNLVRDAARMLVDIFRIVGRDIAGGYETDSDVSSVTRNVDEVELCKA